MRTRYLIAVVSVMSCLCSFGAMDVTESEGADGRLRGTAGTVVSEKKGVEALEAEFTKILSEQRDEVLKRMRGQKPDGKRTEATEQMRFEEAKKTTEKTLEKMKALRTKAAAFEASSSAEADKTNFLGKLDRLISHMERAQKITWAESLKMRADFEKKMKNQREKFDRSKQLWVGTEICETLPFAVEYQRTHAFLAEYDKRIRFKSGKSVGVNPDTGGAGDFAAYALADGTFYLVDGLERAWIRSEYRIDARVESVAKKCGETWVRIPDDSLGVSSWSDSGLTVKTASGERTAKEGIPTGDSLNGKRYLGRITPHGEFISGGAEPVMQKDEVTWISTKISEAVPFAYAWGESKTHKSFAHVAFKSGKKVVTRAVRWEKDENIGVYRLSDGRFLLASREGTLWEEVYCIGLKDESVSLIYKGWSIRIPDDTTSVESYGAGADGASVDVVTQKGREKIRGTDRVADLFVGAKYVGAFANDGSWVEPNDKRFADLVAQKGSDDPLWKEGAARMDALCGKMLKTDQEALKLKIKSVPGWFVSWAGREGYRAYRVFRAEGESCVASFSLAGDAADWKVETSGRSRNPETLKRAAAMVAHEELKKLVE